MLVALLRLMTILALAALPFGMTAAPAAVADSGHQAAGDHCAPPADTAGQLPQTMDCTATCGALPATTDRPFDKPVRRADLPVGLAAIRGSDGTLLEIATPPPRRG